MCFFPPFPQRIFHTCYPYMQWKWISVCKYMGWMYPKCTHKFHSENGVRRGFLDIFGWGDFFQLNYIQGNVTTVRLDGYSEFGCWVIPLGDHPKCTYIFTFILLLNIHNAHTFSVPHVELYCSPIKIDGEKRQFVDKFQIYTKKNELYFYFKLFIASFPGYVNVITYSYTICTL